MGQIFPRGKNISAVSILRLYALATFITTSTSQDVYLRKTWAGVSYEELTTEINKSQNDNRDYLDFKLENGLEVMLISDPGTGVAAASLNVGVGAYSNPTDIPGLAHFCEHMLFMGTEKYPEENAYKKYLSDHSGGANAMTTMEETSYYFHVNSEALNGALDRFSQFFISPLFNRNSIEKEVINVNSEHQKNFQSQKSSIQVQRNVSNPNHPYSFFSTGSYETLLKGPREKGIDIREVLNKFYQKNYSSNIMKLAVTGKESLDDLKTMVIKKFSSIPNHNLTSKPYNEPVFNKNQQGIKINIASIDDIDQMSVEFLLPSQIQYVDEKPLYFLSSYYSDTGNGSLTHFFKEQGLAIGVSSGISEYSKYFALFQIDVFPTPKGSKNQDKILEGIFSYIKLVKENSINEEFYKELQSNADRKFQYEEKFSPVTLVNYASNFMQSPVLRSRLLGAYTRMLKFNTTLILETLQYMNPDNMRVIVSSNSFFNSSDLKTEPWYGTKFSTQEYSKDTLQSLVSVSLNPNLSLPKVNPIKVEDYSLIPFPLNSKVPVLLSNSSLDTLWYINGNMSIPKASIKIVLKNSQIFDSSKKDVSFLMLLELINEHNSVLTRNAQMVGTDIFIMAKNPGLHIQVSGFSDKLDDILLSVVESIKNSEVSDEKFAEAKKKVLVYLMNFNLMTPLEFSSAFFDRILTEDQFSNVENLNEAKKLSKSDLVEFQNSLSEGYLEMLVVGNINIEKTREIMQKVKDIVHLRPISVELKRYPRQYELQPPSQWVYRFKSFNLEDTNSGIGFYLHTFDAADYKRRSLSYLVSNIMHEPFFNQLRTNEKLGYIVAVSEKATSHHGGIQMKVQGEKDPLYVESRIENFLQTFYTALSNRTQNEILGLVHSYQSNIITKDKTLNSFSQQFWNQITSGVYDFNDERDLIANLGTITKESLLEFIRDTILKSGAQRRKLSIQVISAKISPVDSTNYTLADCGRQILEIEAWRRNQTFASNAIPHSHGLYST